ncbi:MAG TPA: NAD(P)H-hydrate epimerase [Anaerolineales bacterium]|nr:NAD(P)H-hydrate epimerase [Anaerolineales bacterium]
MNLESFTYHPNESVSEVSVPSVDETQMREVDRIAMEDFGLGILQMMENAGRSLASLALRLVGEGGFQFVVAAGTGGNGGGGICAARHLYNRGYPVALLLTKPPETYTGAAGVQLNILQKAGLVPAPLDQAADLCSSAALILDALIGYSLKGAPRGGSQHLIEAINASGRPVLSLDLPSGLDATTGSTPGEVVAATATLTLALPKPGLANPTAGKLYLADIGIPPQVYAQMGIHFEPFFGQEYVLQLSRPK